MKTIRCDGGRIECGFLHEHNDCTVRAFAVALEMPYSAAHERLKKAGRKDRCGAYDRQLREAFGITTVPWKGTVARFLREHPKGRFVVRIVRHVFAVVDGVVYDDIPPRPRQRVRYFVNA